MSGQRHSVLTGITLWHVASGRFVSHLEETVLRMDDLAEPQLEAFLDSGDWEGKAGGYAIQGPAGALIPWISGCMVEYYIKIPRSYMEISPDI